MKYYSKPPNEVLKEQHDFETSQKNKKRKIGRFILFADLVVIILVFVYMNNKSQPNSIKPNASKSFIWSKGKIKAKCTFKESCSVQIVINDGIASDKSSLQFNYMRNSKILFSTSHPIEFKNNNRIIEKLVPKTYIEEVSKLKSDSLQLKIIDVKKKTVFAANILP